MRPEFPMPADGRFGVVHHRKLNTRAGVEDAMAAAAALPGYVHLAEGDLCWARVGGETIFYFHHPDRLIDTLSRVEIDRRRAANDLWTLEDALDPRHGDLIYIVELKTGVGSRREAVAEAARRLVERRPGRFWIDTFSPRDARVVKQAAPAAPVSLHTRFLLGRVVVKTALEIFPLGARGAGGLRDVDILTQTYRWSPQSRLARAGFTPEAAARTARDVGKDLVFGGVRTRVDFDRLVGSGARAAYIKFDWRELR